MDDLVSIITPSYKSRDYIAETIKSVQNQTYKNWEMLIIDDNSPDDSNMIIEEFIKEDNRIKLIKLNKNRGPAIARNTGILNAKGKYIAFLDSDDLWSPKKLEKQINFMKKNGIHFTYSSYFIIDEFGKTLGKFITHEKADYKSLLKTNYIGCLTVIYDCEQVGKILMPENLSKHEDYVTWLNIIKKIGNTKGILEPLAYYRVRKNSFSANKITVAKYQWKIYREIENLNIFKSMYYFIHYIYNGIKKHKGHLL